MCEKRCSVVTNDPELEEGELIKSVVEETKRQRGQTAQVDMLSRRGRKQLQRYLAHKKTPTPIGPLLGP